MGGNKWRKTQCQVVLSISKVTALRMPQIYYSLVYYYFDSCLRLLHKPYSHF